MANFKLITVHGTFGEDSSLRGTKWWQKQSSFSERLLSYLDTASHRIDWVPFAWSGKNSQLERRRAARKLTRVLADFRDASHETIACLAHSHGGNVIKYALDREERSGRLDDIQLVTIGTPFFSAGLDTMPGLFLYSLRYVPWLVLAGALFLGAYAYTPIPKEGIYLAAGGLAYVAVLAFSLMWLQASGFGKRFTDDFSEERFKKSFLYRSYARVGMKSFVDQVAARVRKSSQRQARIPKLYSRFDEAINGLVAVPKQSVRLASADILFVPCTIVLSTVLLVLSLVLLLLTPLTGLLPPELKSRLPDTLSEVLLTLGGVAVISTVLSGLLTWLCLGRLTAWFVNLLFKAVVVARAYGMDSREPIGWVAPNPPIPKRERWRALPDAFDREMERQLAPNAQETMQTAREALGVGAVTGTYSLFEAMAGSLSFKEIIHTSYFDNASLIEFVAWILVTKFGFPPSQAFEKIDAQRCESWYAEIAPPPPSHQGDAGAGLHARAHPSPALTVPRRIRSRSSSASRAT